MDEEQGRKFLVPVIEGDTITTVQGYFKIKINSELYYDTNVISELRWIELRKLLAIRVSWLSRELKTSKNRYSTYRMTSTEEKIFSEFEHTWFYQHYMFMGDYCWSESTAVGRIILDRLRTMRALRFD